ncbi:MAG TPA: DUF2277 domain-containing protein [Actinomycetota bacterium]|nr:DUF2277 domain-containing protein [Actinomycetota bacterium]
MCRSIKRLREGTQAAGEAEVREAARQFVRKISGFGSPSPANQEVFDRAIDEITQSSTKLLGALVIGGKAMTAQ